MSSIRNFLELPPTFRAHPTSTIYMTKSYLMHSGVPETNWNIINDRGRFLIPLTVL